MKFTLEIDSTGAAFEPASEVCDRIELREYDADVPPKPRELATEEQAKALDAAVKAQRRFERAQRAYEQAFNERAAAFRAAVNTVEKGGAGVSHGRLAARLGWSRSTVQSVALGRESGRKR